MYTKTNKIAPSQEALPLPTFASGPCTSVLGAPPLKAAATAVIRRARPEQWLAAADLCLGLQVVARGGSHQGSPGSWCLVHWPPHRKALIARPVIIGM